MQMVVHMRPFIGASLRWVLGRGDVDMKSNLPLSNLRSFFVQLCVDPRTKTGFYVHVQTTIIA